ncbi:MAG TPA: transglutaminase domain-containing protein [Rectinemataceae bacterium]|nr:transglutaminase domain-containing protein [Rectinemataceae bacterium]
MSFDLPRSSDIEAARSSRFRSTHPFSRFARRAGVFLLLAGGIAVGASSLSNYLERPVIDRLEPAIGEPGKAVTIIGRNFGAAKADSRVEVDGVAPTSSAYISWSDKEIRLRFPQTVDSGLVHVITRRGSSNPQLFMNKARLPVLAAGGLSGRTGPYIASVSTEQGPIGSLLAIAGLDFGENREEGKVLFPWAADYGANAQLAQGAPTTIEGMEGDACYELWSDKEIKVRVPDGAVSGAIAVATAKGRSNGVFFRVSDAPGLKTYKDPRSYSFSQSVSVANLKVSGPNEFFLWVPRPAECASQRLDRILSQDPVPLIPDYHGTALFRFKDLQNGAAFSIAQSFLVTVYAVETQVNADRISLKPTNPPSLMTDYTRADPVVPSDDPRIKALAESIVGAEANPWRKTRLVWNWVEKNLAWSPFKERMHPQDALKDKSADSYSYALVTCALLRAAGVPSRPIAGYLIDPNRRAVRHYWLEVFIYGLGWVPLDPILGSGASPGGIAVAWDDRSRYLGGVDDRHLAFSRGFSTLAPMAPDGRRVSKERRWSLQSFYEEATSHIQDYSSYWGDIEVTGLY